MQSLIAHRPRRERVDDRLGRASAQRVGRGRARLRAVVAMRAFAREDGVAVFVLARRLHRAEALEGRRGCDRAAQKARDRRTRHDTTNALHVWWFDRSRQEWRE